VPPLRNIALIRPNFHNGLAETMEEAVRAMAQVQLERDLSDGDVASITAFLETLSGPVQVAPLELCTMQPAGLACVGATNR
jgi:cytochrome c peroxidase